MKINDFLVQHLHISKDEARELILEQRVQINGTKALQQYFLKETDSIEMDGKMLRLQVVYKYYAFYKPRGIECTLNPDIPNNLRSILPFDGHFYPVGRLDKQSEGLLLLTNDGKLCQQISASENFKEKEYEVSVQAELSEEALQQLASGILILGDKKTRPAIVTRINSNSFRIILTQGLNRQIRRMCHKIGHEVKSLRRVRISMVTLGNLQPGEFVELEADEI